MAYADSIGKLPKRLREISDEQDANAAVAVLLKPSELGLNILFVERAENSADPWSGQIAFPGGKRSSEDMSLLETVTREIFEETNISILGNCRFLGVLPPMQTRTRPELKILPFIILVESDQAIRLNEKELTASFWIPLEKIVNNKSTIRTDLGEQPAYVIGDTVVWGLTYRILETLIQALETA